MSHYDEVPYEDNALDASPASHVSPPSKDEFAGAASSERAGVYVYCVAPDDRWRTDEAHIDVPGVGDRGDRIRVVHAPDGHLAALVSDSPQGRYAISRRNLLAHERVIERAMASSDVLPIQFGRVAASDQEVRETLLEAQSQILHELLEYVHGKVELSLKVLWRRNQLFADIVAEDAMIRHLRDSTLARPTFSEQLMLGQLVERAVANKREREADRILAGLRPHAADTRLNELMSDMMVLNVAFLVNRTEVDEFDDAVDRLELQNVSALSFRYVGPLPPYSFVHTVS